MIEPFRLDHPVEVIVEFDEYLPVTITWPDALSLDPPTYRRYASGGSVLELKFNPLSRRIVEAVLVTASDVRQVAASLAPVSSDKLATVGWAERQTSERSKDTLLLAAYQDFLLISLSVEPVAEWIGALPVYFGISQASCAVALCVQWDSSDSRPGYAEPYAFGP